MYLLYYVRAIHVAQDLQISIMLNYRITALMCRLLYLYCYSFALLYCCADILDFTSQSHGGQVLVCRLIYSKSKICHRPMCEIRNERQNLIQNRKSILRDHNWDFALSFSFCASVIFRDWVPSLKPQIRKDVTSTCSLFLSVQNISQLLNRC